VPPFAFSADRPAVHCILLHEEREKEEEKERESESERDGGR
jgi:hypothetical protein